ncbi:MAG: hypothetical protein R2784_10980 [Saprospiraceae bacterium]
MAGYGAYGILSGIGTKTAFFIDTLMVSALIDFNNTEFMQFHAFCANTIGQLFEALWNCSTDYFKAYAENNLED